MNLMKPHVQTLTVDHHLVGVLGFVDRVAELTDVLSVVLFLQRVDLHGAHVGGEHHALTGGQLPAVFQPGGGLHVAGCRLAAQVG